jgi:hypothetical protein
MDGFTGFTQVRILDREGRILVNQLKSKIYSHANVYKSSNAVFQTNGFYYYIRMLPMTARGNSVFLYYYIIIFACNFFILRVDLTLKILKLKRIDKAKKTTFEIGKPPFGLGRTGVY